MVRGPEPKIDGLDDRPVLAGKRPPPVASRLDLPDPSRSSANASSMSNDRGIAVTDPAQRGIPPAARDPRVNPAAHTQVSVASIKRCPGMR